MILIEDKSREQKEAIISFLKSMDKPILLGMSGGLDSSVVAKLCSESIRTRALMLPERTTPEGSTEDAIDLARELGIEYEVIDIDSAVRALGPFKSRASEANAKARVRMCFLYKKANEEGCLVAGTGNKSEIMVGYSTKFGDGACDLLPIGDQYKTEVRFLAKEIGIAEKIIRKVPSADLYPGQTDEGELGIDYTTLDLILRGLELQVSDEAIASELGKTIDTVRRIKSMVYSSKHKRSPPLIVKLGTRTPWVDWL